MIGKFIGARVVKLATVVDTKTGKTSEQQRNRETGLGGSVGRVGMIHLPIVQRSQGGGAWEIVCGRHRIRAARDGGQKAIEVRVWQGTPGEAALLKVEENLRRSYDGRDALIRQLDELEQAISDDPGIKRTLSGELRDASERGRPLSNRAIARHVVAEARGVEPETIAKAEQRARAEASGSGPAMGRANSGSTGQDEAPGTPDAVASQEGAAGEDPAASSPAPPIVTFGLPLNPELDAKLTVEIQAIDAADVKIRAALTVLSVIRQDAPRYAALYEQVQRAGQGVRAAKPDRFCPWCKRAPALMPICMGCRGAGVLSVGQLEGITVPEELQHHNDGPGMKGMGAKVALNGKFIPYADALKLPAPRAEQHGNGAAGVKQSRRRLVEMPDGTNLDLNAVSDEDIPF